MTQKEALDQHVHPDLTERWGQPVTEAVIAAITTYHEQQVKNCDLADVGGSLQSSCCGRCDGHNDICILED